MLVIPELGRQKQEDQEFRVKIGVSEFKVNPDEGRHRLVTFYYCDETCH